MCTNITLSFVSSWCSISTIWQLGRAGSWVAGSGPEGEESPLSSASAPLLAELVAALSSAREQGTGAGALGARVLALARAAPGYRVCCSALGRGARAALDALLLDYRGGV